VETTRVVGTARTWLSILALGGGASACDQAGPSTGASASAPGPTAALTVPSASASSAPATPRYNVIVVVIDSLRADRMAWNGYAWKVAPRLEAFAAQAVNYTQFFSLSSYTAMTFGGFVAARYPSEVPRSGYFFSRYPDEVRTFPEVLQEGGVRTLAGMAHWYFNRDKAGLHQGFDVWEIVEGLKKSNTTDENVTSPQHLEMALRQLGDRANHGGPFFAWYHFTDPHDMYMGHRGTPSFGPGAQGMYDGEIHFTDAHVGKLIDYVEAQPWGERTAILVTSDHGETFGEHDMYRHGFELWQELVWVPLLIRVPGVAPRQIDEPRGGIDIPPTLLELLGVAADPAFRGRSLLSEMRGGAVEPRPVIIDLPRTGDNDRRRALIWGKHKLIAHGDDRYFKLFDLEADPRELRDLASSDKELFERMRRRYEEESKRIEEVCPELRDKLMGKSKNKPC
jgi:arylsulfatase A-like enzyme